MDVLRGMRWLALCLAGMLVVLAVVWLASRLRGAPPGQRAALATMQATWIPPGRNAFDAVWLLRWDVPEAPRAAIVARDMSALQARPAWPTGSNEPFVSSAAAGYADLRPVQATVAPCGAREDGCLARVRADLPAYAALVEANATLIARIGALAQYDHYRSKLPPRLDAPLPELGHAGLAITAHAVHFAQGRYDLALDGVCRDIATWRRLGVHSDSLVVRMLGIALATDGHGRLLADMLQVLPRDHALPGACAAALAAPSSGEADLCPAMRGEFAWASPITRLLADPATPADERPSTLLFDVDATLALQAANMADACSEATRVALASDLPAPLPAPRRSVWLRLECAANAVGCILGDIAAPDYIEYQHRAQDQNARLQLLATLAWLRDTAGDGARDAMPAERIAHRPAALRSPARDIEVAADGRAIRIAQYATARGAYWQLPLPDYLVDASPPAD
ncbi:hypothetical protein LDO26_07640 [Luteimonas sp. BDR2-5]|uniref:hypothetical protein n=1 Tax=Proluteimonas luteida TaxID=2878685 RepID=UPI001E508256|nr:hypothetical protein [Luteimonas sp. BDR2-5]MCD9028079.1 hypothetical protein [Luteimonas sp. BDR2-5]